MIKAQRFLCIMKFLDTNPAGWKCYLKLYLKKMGGKFLFHFNYDLTKLSIALPDFYKECVLTWSLNKYNTSSLSDIVNEVLWNNKFILM